MKHDPVSAFDNDNIIEGIPLSSYQMLKLVEERGGVGFWSLEIATRGLWGSPGFHRVTGLPATDDLRGLFRRLIHPDDQAAQADLWDLIQLGHVVDREFRIIRPDQTVRWVALKTGVVLGPDALPARTDGVLLDTTATHEARQIAAWMQGRQTGVLRAITAATWSAHPAGEIEMAAGWERLTGQTATEMAGFGWLNALHPDDRRVALAAWQAARTTGAPYRAEYRVRGADGTYRRFSSRGAAQAGPDGAVREWFGLVLAVPDDARDAVPDAAIGPLIRGGRAVLGWSIQDLAAASGVSGSSVRRMEEFGEGPRPKIRQAVRQAFEGAGIQFSALGADRVAIEVDAGRFPSA